MALGCSVFAACALMMGAAVKLHLNGYSPLLSLPLVCAAIAAAGTFVSRRVEGKQAQILEKMDADAAAVLMRLRIIDRSVAFAIVGVGVWALAFNGAPCLTGMILARDDPSVRFFVASYPGWSALCMWAGSLSAAVLVARSVVWREAGGHLGAWLEFSTSEHWGLGNRPRLVLWLNTVVLVCSILPLVVLLPCGTAIGPRGITVSRIGHLQVSHYTWNQVRKAEFVSEGLLIWLTDGSRLMVAESDWDDHRVSMWDVHKEFEKRGKWRW